MGSTETETSATRLPPLQHTHKRCRHYDKTKEIKLWQSDKTVKSTIKGQVGGAWMNVAMTFHLGQGVKRPRHAREATAS